MSVNKMKDEKRYCKHCGGEIDPNTKICRTCGKQYFKGKNILKKAPGPAPNSLAVFFRSF